MKKRLIVLLIMGVLMFGLAGCGNAKDYGNVGGQSVNFVEVPNSKLIYDTNTNIVYISFHTYQDRGYSAYLAPNGLPYKYNVKTNKLEEISE